MNDDERARVLRMVAEGKLSPEEAANLLDALEPDPEPQQERSWYSSSPDAGAPGGPPPGDMTVRAQGRERSRGRAPRAVVIQIKEGGDNKVNVRIPLGLAR